MEIFGVIVQALTAVAIIFAAWQLLFHSRAMHREFELLYVERYWALMDRRSEQFALTGNPDDSDRLVIRGYLQLCEDECDLRGLGRVTDNTWSFWGISIATQLGEASYGHELELAEQSLYPQVRAILSSAGKKDPLRWGWFRRKVHGL